MIRPKNLLLISIDCLRWDAVGHFGKLDRWEGRSLTPTIDALASEAAAFPLTITAAPFTTPSHASVFTGRYPFDHGVRLLVNQRLDRTSPTLPEILTEYDRVAVPGVFVLDRASGLLRGFDTAFEVDEREDIATARGGHHRCGPRVNELFGNWLDRRQSTRPWFAFLHYFDAHTTANDRSFEHYMNGIRLIDDLLSELLSRVDLDRTVVCIFGDHGEGLGEGEAHHGKTLSESVVRVPVIIHGAGHRGVHWQLRRTIDIAPTLLGALGQAVPASMYGHDLFDEQPRMAYSETCPCQLFGQDATPSYHGPERVTLRNDRYKYERRFDGGEQLFAVAPESNRETEIRDRESAARVRDDFAAHFHEYPALCGREQFDTTYLDDPKVIARLQALGYLE